jgi:hypothetical protein
MKSVIWLWLTVLGLCGLCFFAPGLLFFGHDGYNPKAACISNQKQIMTSLAIYGSDFDDFFPPCFSFDGIEKQKAFMIANRPYLPNDRMYLCPVELGNIADKKPSSPSAEGLPGKMEYVHCLSLKGVIPEFSTGKRLLSSSAVPEPAKTPYMRDIIRGYEGKGVQRFTSSHGPSFGVSYIDTHVKNVKLNINNDL